VPAPAGKPEELDPDVVAFAVEDPPVGGRLGLELGTGLLLAGDQAGDGGEQFLRRGGDLGRGGFGLGVTVGDCAVRPAMPCQPPGE
jgi:hypothetical protein